VTDDTAPEVEAAIVAIGEAARVVGNPDSGIDEAQIDNLLKAMDQLENDLIVRKRALDEGW
jgi:hypothetical protein